MIKFAVLGARILIATIRVQTHSRPALADAAAAQGGWEGAGGQPGLLPAPGDPPAHSCLGSAALINTGAL